MRVLVIAWAPGGNLPPMLAAASLMARRDHDVRFLASGETHAAVERLGFQAARFERTPDPDTSIAFEAQAEATMALLAGPELARDARDAVEALHPDLAIVDCMLPAAIAGARAAGVRTASLVHFLYGLARRLMREAGGGWTTDLRALATTHRMLGLPPPVSGVEAWEAPELVLVTAPGWFDIDAGFPDHVVHAGPLNVATHTAPGRHDRPRVLLTFSSTIMEGQPELIARVCAAVAEPDVDAVLTLGPALDPSAIRVSSRIEVLTVADHDRLMPDCAAVISHGGLGTVLRALAHGVPQVLLPLGRDQELNAGRVEQLGAGIRLPTDAPAERIRAALHELISESRVARTAAELRDRIAADDPDRSAVEVLERVGHEPAGPLP
jgi:UDP:flavonoid glycosyltransferase YjiC (YdhE family)